MKERAIFVRLSQARLLILTWMLTLRSRVLSSMSWLERVAKYQLKMGQRLEQFSGRLDSLASTALWDRSAVSEQIADLERTVADLRRVMKVQQDEGHRLDHRIHDLEHQMAAPTIQRRPPIDPDAGQANGVTWREA